MSSHLNRADRVASAATACDGGPTIGYDTEGRIVVLCRDDAAAPLVQEILIWFVLTCAVFVVTQALLSRRSPRR